MARYSNNIASLYQPQTITVNGVKMTIKEFKNLQKSKMKKKKPAKSATSITILPAEIKAMLKNVKVLDSLISYHTHAYRQWGTIARDLMNLKEIKEPFNNLVINAKQAIRLVTKINNIAKQNDKDVFQYVLKLAWKLDDVKNHLALLVDGIEASGIIPQFAKHECIYGEGKRLGLKVLTIRSYTAIGEIEKICHRLNAIEHKGMDISEYHTTGRQIK